MGGGILPPTLDVHHVDDDVIGIFSELSGEGFTAALIPALDALLDEGPDGSFVSRLRGIVAYGLLAEAGGATTRLVTLQRQNIFSSMLSPTGK